MKGGGDGGGSGACSECKLWGGGSVTVGAMEYAVRMAGGVHGYLIEQVDGLSNGNEAEGEGAGQLSTSCARGERR